MARPSLDRPLSLAGLVHHWRGLRWAPPLLAGAITLEVAAGGSNDWASQPAAALVNLLIAASVLLAVKPSSRVWNRMRGPFRLFVAALLLAALPWLLPPAVAGWLDVPPALAPDRLLPAFADTVSRLLLVLAACAAAYRLHAVRPIVWWFALAGGLYIGWMALTPLPWRFLGGDGHGRFAATIGNWNSAGVYFGMNAMLCLAAILTHAGVRRRGWYWVFAVPLLAALTLCMATQSRSAFTLTALALVVALVWNARGAAYGSQRRYVAGLAVALGLATVAMASIGAEALFPRYLEIGADGLSRWDIITTYAGYTADSPVWGFGPGSFFAVNQARLAPETALRFWNFGAAHNAVLQIALEDGWPVVLLIGAGVAAIGRDIARRAWGADEICLAGALIILFGASMVDIAWNVPALGALGCVLLGSLWGGRVERRPGTQLIRRNSTGSASGVPATS